jgi:hypothetical protein
MHLSASWLWAGLWAKCKKAKKITKKLQIFNPQKMLEQLKTKELRNKIK